MNQLNSEISGFWPLSSTNWLHVVIKWTKDQPCLSLTLLEWETRMFWTGQMRFQPFWKTWPNCMCWIIIGGMHANKSSGQQMNHEGRQMKGESSSRLEHLEYYQTGGKEGKKYGFGISSPLHWGLQGHLPQRHCSIICPRGSLLWCLFIYADIIFFKKIVFPVWEC